MTILTQHPWIAVSVGTLFVAFGGLFATWGWNQSSELRNRQNLITTVVEEWRLNDATIKKDLALARSWNVRGKEDSFSRQPYKSARLNTLISSGLFGQQHEAFINASQNYESAIGDMEAALRIVGRLTPGIFINTQLIHDPPDELPKDEGDLLSKPFLSVLKAHRQLGVVLSTEFPKLFK